MSAEARIIELKLELPKAPKPVATYKTVFLPFRNAVKQSMSLVATAIYINSVLNQTMRQHNLSRIYSKTNNLAISIRILKILDTVFSKIPHDNN